MTGVSIDFFCRSVAWLEKAHGDRYFGERFEELRELLQRVEELWVSMEAVEKTNEPRRTTT